MFKSVRVNAVLNMIRQLLAIIFPMVTVYYATRALGQTCFGEVNYIRSIISYFSLFAGLGISNYAIREGASIRDDKNKYNHFACEIYTINILSTIVSFLGLIVLCVLWYFLGRSYDVILAIILSLTIVLTTLGADWINSTFEDFKYLTIRYIISYSIAIVLLFLLVRNEEDSFWYATVTVIATAGGNIFNVFYIRRYVKLHFIKLKQVIKHLKPILVLFGSSIATVIYISSDTTMLGMMINNEAVAIYTVSSNIYLAVKHISNSAIMVAVPRFSNYIGSKQMNMYYNLLNRTVSYIIVILFPLVAGTFALSDSLMCFMGGEDYLYGADSLRILSVALLFAVFSFVISRCITLPFKDDYAFTVSTILSAVVNVILNIILIPRLSLFGASITTLISEIIVFTVLSINSRKYAKISLNFKVLISSVLGCIVILVICWIFNILLGKSYLLCMIVSFIVSAFSYFIILLLLKNEVVIESLGFVKSKIKHNNGKR